MMKSKAVKAVIMLMELGKIDFMHLPPSVRETKKVALAAVRQDPKNLFFTSQMRDDYDAVKGAVERDGMMLAYASKRLRYKKELAELAVRQTGKAFSLLPKELRKSPKLLRLALETSPDAILHGFAFQKHDPGLVMMAVKGDPDLLGELVHDDALYASDFSEYADTPWALDSDHYVVCKNRDIVLEAVKGCGAMVQYASDALKRDPDVVRAALKEEPDAYVYLDEGMLKRLGFYEE